jgi:hypothetical protein
MQDQKIEQLEELIHSSAVLTAEEKSDWLLTLPVMNSKQRMDLALILKAKPKPAPSPTKSSPYPVKPLEPVSAVNQKPPVISSQTAPALGHIANLPNFLRPVEPTKPVAPLSVSPKNQHIQTPAFLPQDPWAKKLHETVMEKELPAPVPAVKILPEALEARLSPVIEVVKQPQNTAGPLPRDHEDFWSQLAKKEPSSPEPPKAVLGTASTSALGVLPLTMDSVDDVERIGVLHVRTLSRELLIQKLQELVRKHGYITVSEAFEKSPLYKEYILLGQEALQKNVGYEQLLSSKKDGSQIALRKDEFEAVTDILRNMQVN